jgi:hypothetical protein
MPNTLRSPRHEALRALLIEWRKEAGLTQTDVARRLDATSPSLRLWRPDSAAWMLWSSWTSLRHRVLARASAQEDCWREAAMSARVKATNQAVEPISAPGTHACGGADLSSGNATKHPSVCEEVPS